MKPMLATLIKEPFDSDEWIFETKFDGFRALAHKKKSVELLSRNNLSFNKRFPELVEEIQKLPGSFILDGEIVVLDKKGISHFQLLQNKQNKAVGDAYYYLFDILFYNGKDLTSLPLMKRREILSAFLKKTPSKHLRLSKAIEGRGKALFAKAKKEGWEGIIAKRKESVYTQSRSREWLKIKTQLRQEFVIGGYTAPRGSRKKFGSLLLGVYEGKDLIYAGHVGTGFSSKVLDDVYKQLRKKVSSHCPFSKRPKKLYQNQGSSSFRDYFDLGWVSFRGAISAAVYRPPKRNPTQVKRTRKSTEPGFSTASKPNDEVVWLKPELVCEVSFTEWTQSGNLRHPSFQGMRPDKPARKVVRERPIT